MSVRDEKYQLVKFHDPHEYNAALSYLISERQFVRISLVDADSIIMGNSDVEKLRSHSLLGKYTVEISEFQKTTSVLPSGQPTSLWPRRPYDDPEVIGERIARSVRHLDLS